MILGITETIEDMFNKLGNFVKDHYDSPIFWGVLFLVILGISVYVISELGDK